MRSKKLLTVVIAVVVAAGMMFGGCAPDGNDTIDMVYVQWACAESQTFIMEAVLEDAGYNVELTAVAAGPMWTSVGSGDADVFVCAWLPHTHEAYMDEYAGQIEDLGPNYEGARIGLVVPHYADINSIDELNAHGDEFDWTIYGIEPGSGIMHHTYEEAVPGYELDDWTVMDASDMAMTVALDSAYQADEWVVVTGWAPHWKFFAYDLEFLDDPQEAYGGAETINSIARQGFSADMPGAASILSNFYLTEEQLAEVMYEINVEGVAPAVAARQWVDENQDVVSQWLA